MRRLPPLHAVRAFEATARHLSMTRAAEELAVTPGAISRHVRTLESHLDQSLLLRRPSGLVLTAAGASLAAAARDGLDRIAGAAEGVKRLRLRPLAIGGYGYFLSRILLPRWCSLRVDCPGLEVDLHSSLDPHDLIPSHYDAVIAVTDGSRRPGLTIRPLVPIRTIAVCAADLLVGPTLDLGATPLLHTRPRPDDWHRWLEYARISGIRSAGKGSSFESIALTMEAATAGLGAAIAIEALVEQELASGALVRAHPTIRPTRRSFSLIYDSRLAGDAALRAFETWLLDITAEIRSR